MSKKDESLLSILRDLFCELFGGYIAVVIGGGYFLSFVVAIFFGYQIAGLWSFLVIVPVAIAVVIPTMKLVRFFDD